MSAYPNFIISTTPTLEGYKIKNYFGTLTSHVVAGTGLFSDFAASMSDIFGGRSESYQKQLISLKEEVFKRLKDDAKVLGANGIVGLKVDFDEISGKGKTMFMVSALGTAVLLETIDKGVEELHPQSYTFEQINAEKLNIEIEKHKLINFLKHTDYSPTKDDWEYITENAITEVFDALFDFVNKKSELWSYISDPLYLVYANYINNLPNEYLIDNIYKLYYANNVSIRDLAFTRIEEHDLLNTQRLKKMLNADNLIAKKYALKTLYNCDKKFYDKKDIQEFEDIKNDIKNNFPEIGERINKKKMMSTTQKENWNCPNCKKENSIEDEFCKKCSTDIRGFLKSELTPEKVIKWIEHKTEILDNMLKQQR